MAGQHGACQEKEWQMANVYRFHRSQQGHTKRQLPIATNGSGCGLCGNAAIMSLLDCFSRYHQCWMAKEDEEKTSFITPFGTFCFVRMPEGLKNAGSTFTRMTGTVFKPQIGKNIQVYGRRPHRQEFQPGQPRKRFG
jgi:hypothetical protein